VQCIETVGFLGGGLNFCFFAVTFITSSGFIPRHLVYIKLSKMPQTSDDSC